MLVLHAHYQPPQTPEETGGVLFWAETSDTPEPVPQRGRTAKIPRPKAHPFNAAPDFKGKKQTVTLRLPAIRGVPLPSPQLIHNWDLEFGTIPALAPFWVNGILGVAS